MAEDREIDQTVKWLLPFHSQLSELNVSILNTGLRKGLRLLAAKHRLQYTQDDVGNIYISSPGRDPQLSPMGLCFPLDASKSPEAFEGALRTFLSLQNRSLTCGVTLIGWSSPEGKILGRDAWQGVLSTDAVYSQYPDIKQFSTMAGVDKFTVSALFDIASSQSDSLSVQGSPVLVQKATEATPGAVMSKSYVQAPGRAPEVKIEGKAAVSLGITTVDVYNRYVAALFENFE